MLCDLPIHDVSVGGNQVLLFPEMCAGHQDAATGNLQSRLRLRSGRRHVLVGPNGCGKTTLLGTIAAGLLDDWPSNLHSFLVSQKLTLEGTSTPLEALLAADTRLQSEASALQDEASELETECAECIATCGNDEPSLEGKMSRICEIYELLGDIEDEGVRHARASVILRGLGFDMAAIQSPINRLSRGWQSRVALACGLFVEPELLLLDEPTNHLDLDTIAWLQEHLVHRFKGTLLCASHDRAFVDAIAEELIVFREKGLEYFRGSLGELDRVTASATRGLERQVASLERHKEHVRQSLQSIKAAEAKAQENRAANRESNRYAQFNMDGRARTDQGARQVAQRLKKLNRMGLEKTADGKKYCAQEASGPRIGSANRNEGGWVEGKMTAAPVLRAEQPLPPFQFATADPLGLPAGAPLLECRGVDFGLNETSGNLLEGVWLTLSLGCRIAVTGGNGAGKSLLLGLVAGELPASQGEVWRTRGLCVAYLEQQHVDWMMWQAETPLGYMHQRCPGCTEQALLDRLEQFGVPPDLASRSMAHLSGGQCAAVAFSRVAAEGSHLLVLDEPTSNLDIYSIAALTAALKEFEGGVIFATHDRHLLQEVADDVVDIRAWGAEVQNVSQASTPERAVKRDRTWREPLPPD